MRPGGGWRAKSRRGPALQIRCGPGDCSGSSPGEIAATTQLSHGLRWPRHKRSIAVIRPPWKHTRHRRSTDGASPRLQCQWRTEPLPLRAASGPLPLHSAHRSLEWGNRHRRSTGGASPRLLCQWRTEPLPLRAAHRSPSASRRPPVIGMGEQAPTEYRRSQSPIAMTMVKLLRSDPGRQRSPSASGRPPVIGMGEKRR